MIGSIKNVLMSIIDRSKPARNKRLLRRELRKGMTKVESYPEEITLSTTTRCNKNPPCVICDRNVRTPEAEYDCPDEIIEKLKSALEYVDILYLHCGGEPLIYAGFDRIINSVKPPSKIRFNSNGVLLTEDKIRKIMDSGTVDVINFSIDAATEGTYRKLRGEGFNRVIENIKRIKKRKEETGKTRPEIIINMCVMKENFQEMPAFVELAREVGASAVDFFHLNKGRDWKIPGKDGFIFDYKEQEIMDPDLHDEKVVEAYDKCRELGININFVGSVFMSQKDKERKEEFRRSISEIEKMKKPLCIAPWSRAVIGTEGSIRMCYYHDGETESIGNLKNDDFRSIWNGKEAEEIRKEFLEKRHSKLCVKENSCMFMGRI